MHDNLKIAFASLGTLFVNATVFVSPFLSFVISILTIRYLYFKTKQIKK